MTPIKAIRLKCLDCSGGAISEVEKCVIPDCVLYPFRMGKNPNRQKIILSPERKKELSDRMKKMVADQKASKSKKTVTS
jgi:hypothetical protein